VNFQTSGSTISGLGHFQPERVLTNDELSETVDTTDEWIRTRTGIRERRIAGADDTVASMAVAAGRHALADAGVDEVSMVIVASTTSTNRSPNTAARVSVVLEASAEQNVSQVVWGSVPELVDAVRIDGDPALFAQEGRSVYRWAITEAARHATRVVDASGFSIDDIDVFAFHQANLRIIDPLAEALGGADKIVIRDIEKSGNNSAASVPLGLSKAWHAGDIPPGSRALLFGFGGGFTYAGQVVRLPATQSKGE